MAYPFMMKKNPEVLVHDLFKKRFGTDPLLIWSPGRINVIGEHTDYNLGYVLPAAIDLGIAMAIQVSGKGISTLVAADPGEEYTFNSAQSLPLEMKGWKAYLLGILHELEKKALKIPPFNLLFSGNIPAGAGLSSSAALENAFVFGLNELFRLGLSRMEMVEISHAAEQNYAGVQCGIMDQYTGMFGQAGKAIFLDCRSLSSELIPLETGDYRWLLLDTGVKHSLANSAYNNRREVCEQIATHLGKASLREVSFGMLEKILPELEEADYQKARFVLEENARVLSAVDALKKEDLRALGQLMWQSHEGLRQQYRVSCEELDILIDFAKQDPGVIGARMMGGGFGGCTLNLVKKDACDAFIAGAQQTFTLRFGESFTYYIVNLSEGCHLTSMHTG